MAITVLVVMLGFAVLSMLTGHAYASLPGGSPARPSPASLSSVASPHQTEPVCGACHRTHVATDPALLIASDADSAICIRCHSAAIGATEVSSHSNIDFAAKQQQPFYASCVMCHDPHGNPDAGNKDMIRTDIGGLAVSFTSTSGAGSFDDGMDNGLHDSICVVCHTATLHNNVNSPELQGAGHGPVGTDCTSCHKHGGSAASRSGFMPDATATPTVTPLPPTDTPTSVPPTATDTPTPVPADTNTPTPTDTDTPTPMPTDTPAAATPTPG